MCAEHEEEDVVVVWREPKREGKGKKKSAKARFQIWELPRSLQLTRKTLDMDVHVSAAAAAAEEDKNFEVNF